MKDPSAFIDCLENIYKFKLKGTGPLRFHLGCDFDRDPDGTLYMAPKKYIERLIDSYMRMFGEKPRRNVQSPLDQHDHPELDDSELLGPDDIEKYQSLVGSMQWAVSLGRFDIATAVMTLSSYRAAPRAGHLQRAKRVCGYLLQFQDAKIRFRTGYPDHSDVPTIDLTEWERSVYGKVSELIPDDIPPPLGKPVVFTHYFDANLMHDLLTGRSVTGILHFVNQTPMDWFSKKQGTVETATYGSEFVAGRTCVEQTMDFRTTFRYLGVPIVSTSYTFGDNESMIKSSTRFDAKLSKRHVALSFHRVREAMASGMINLCHVKSKHNPADMLSKFWTHNAVWKYSLQPLLFWAGDTLDCYEEDQPKQGTKRAVSFAGVLSCVMFASIVSACLTNHT
jgi:hypothetical protein